MIPERMEAGGGRLRSHGARKGETALPLPPVHSETDGTPPLDLLLRETLYAKQDKTSILIFSKREDKKIILI